MFCLATPLFVHGRKVPRSRHGALTKDGRFRMTERFDATSHRTLRVARIVPMSGLAADRERDLLPPLWDATILFADGGYWTVTGIEREAVEGDEVSVRQTWAMRELPPDVCEEIENAISMGRQASAPLTLKWSSAVPPPSHKPPDPRAAGGMTQSYQSR